MTRCWSKWTDGSVTHSDSVVEYHEIRGHMMGSTSFVNIGAEPNMRPPLGLAWVDTRAIRRDGAP